VDTADLVLNCFEGLLIVNILWEIQSQLPLCLCVF